MSKFLAPKLAVCLFVAAGTMSLSTGLSTKPAYSQAANCNVYAANYADRRAVRSTVGGALGGAVAGGVLGALVGKGKGKNIGIGAAVGAGVGTAGGAVRGSRLWQQRYNRAYRDCMNRRAPRPAVLHPAPYQGARPAAWTPEWYEYCSAKYRSFDAASGTYQPYNGPRRLCR